MEEKKNLQKALLLLFFALGLIFFLFTFGPNLLGGIATFFSSLNKNGRTTSLDTLAPPPPPRFRPAPDATNQKSFNLEGTAKNGNTVMINFNGTEEEILVDSSGSFNFKVSLKEGINTYFAYAKDTLGKESQKTDIHQIIFDKEQPKIAITNPADGASFFGSRNQNIEILGSTEIDSSLTVNDRIIAVDSDGLFKTDYLLSEGENTLLFKATDKAGNISEKKLKLNYFP